MATVTILKRQRPTGTRKYTAAIATLSVIGVVMALALAILIGKWLETWKLIAAHAAPGS